MKELKERFSKWYNKRHGRRGTLWMDRYKSVLVEGPRTDAGAQLDALRVMALYIDLNPIRAGIVEDPAEYRWSGYGAAVGGASKEAREGLTALVGARSWKQASETICVGNGKVLDFRPDRQPSLGRSSVLRNDGTQETRSQER